MALPPKKLEEFESDIHRLTAEGMSSRKIVDWLAERGVKTNRNVVSKFVTQSRMERAETSKAMVRERLASHVTSDLDRLEEICAEAKRRGAEEENNEVWVKISKLEVDVRKTKIALSGANEPDTSATEMDAAEAAVLARLDRLATAKAS